jgi:hypothetical protein
LYSLADFAALVVVGALHQPARPVEANHAWTHAQGIGYDGIGPGFGWVDVYAASDTTALYAQAVVAIDKWRAFHTASDGSLWWLRHSTDRADFNQPFDNNAGAYPGYGSAEVLDAGRQSVFSGSDWFWHSVRCNDLFANGANGGTYATTLVTDKYGSNGDNFRLTDGGGYWSQNPGVPFHHATVCLNPAHNDQNQGGLDGHNNPGTIAHELGHVLGLDHPLGNAVNAPACPTPAAYTGYDTIMAYNYSGLSWLWPAADGYGTRGPTSADIDGPWVCNWGNAGGLAYVYGVHTGGFGILAATPTPTPTATDTPRPTRTPTPTNTPTPTFTPTATYTPTATPTTEPDTDGDGCDDTHEPLLVPPTDPVDPWDFYSVPVPALFSAPDRRPTSRTRPCRLPTVRRCTRTSRPGRTRGLRRTSRISTRMSVKDGVEYDRSQTGVPAQSGPPGGVIAASDAQLAYAQFTHHYSC